jgi:hypothetical protein
LQSSSRVSVWLGSSAALPFTHGKIYKYLFKRPQEQRRQEAIDAYWKGRAQWPNEARVRDLADLFVN